MRWAVVPVSEVVKLGFRLDTRPYLGRSKTQCLHELKVAKTRLAQYKSRVKSLEDELRVVEKLPEGQVALFGGRR